MNRKEINSAIEVIGLLSNPPSHDFLVQPHTFKPDAACLHMIILMADCLVLAKGSLYHETDTSMRHKNVK